MSSIKSSRSRYTTATAAAMHMILLQSSWVMELVTWCDVSSFKRKLFLSAFCSCTVNKKRNRKKDRNDYGREKHFISNIKTNLSPYSTLSEWWAKP